MLLFAFTASRFFPMRLCHGGPAISISSTLLPASLLHLPMLAMSSRWCSAAAPQPAKAPLQRPGQQHTSSVGEKYSGLASNLGHLGRIC